MPVAETHLTVALKGNHDTVFIVKGIVSIPQLDVLPPPDQQKIFKSWAERSTSSHTFPDIDVKT